MLVLRIIVWNMLHLIVLGFDVTAFFLVISLVVLVKDVNWLTPLHRAGRDLVNIYTNFVDRHWKRLCHRPLTPIGSHLVGLAILELAKMILVSGTRAL